MSRIHVFKSYLVFLHSTSKPADFSKSALLKLSSSLASSKHTPPLSSHSKDSQEGSAHIVQERKDYWITVDFAFKRFPSLCQRFVPLRCSLTYKSLYLAQLRGLKDILKPNCCKEFLCTAGHLCLQYRSHSSVVLYQLQENGICCKG